MKNNQSNRFKMHVALIIALGMLISPLNVCWALISDGYKWVESSRKI